MKLKLKKIKRTASIPFEFPPDYTIEWKENNSSESGITCSLLQKFLRCRQAFLYTIHRWEPKGNLGSGLLYGSMFHDFLERLYKRKKKMESIGIKTVFNNYVKNNKHDFRSVSPDEILRLKTLASVMAEMYQEFYKNDFKTFDFRSLEEEFDIEWNGYRLRGKRDGLVNEAGDRLLLWENKNYSRINAELSDILHFDFQCLVYVLATEAEKLMTVSGVKYNVVRVPQNKFTGSVKEYRDTIREAVESKPDYYFIRYDVQYTDRDKRKFGIELKAMLDECKALINGDIQVYKNVGACLGQYKCSFIQACSANSLRCYQRKQTRFPELSH